MTRESAPLKDKAHENAVRITESAAPVLADSKSKFLTWVQSGKEGLKKQYGLDEAGVAEVMNRPEVAGWQGQLEGSLAGGLSLQEYGERYLRNQGVKPETAKAQTERVAGLVGKEDLTETLLATPAVAPEVRQRAGEMQKVLAEDPQSNEMTTGVLLEMGHATVDDLYNALVRTGRVDEDTLRLLPTGVIDYVYAKARDHEQALDVLRAASETADVPVRQPVDSTLKPVKRILENEKQRAAAAAEVEPVSAVAPANFLSKVLNGLIADPLALLGDTWQQAKDLLKTPNWWEAKSPEFAEYRTRSQQLGANTHKMERESINRFYLDAEGNFTLKYENAGKDPVVRGALNKWIGLNMARGGDAVVMVSPDDPGVARILHGLPDAKRQSVIDLMNKVVESKGMADAQKREKMLAKTVVDGAKILNPVMGLKLDQNEKLSEAIMQALMNPATLRQGYGQIWSRELRRKTPRVRCRLDC
jgi:hypothetical protein